jgi:Arc/MetJ-type ribon-helix-helix transcriptional regulator
MPRNIRVGTTISPTHKKVIDELVRQGLYKDPPDFIRQAIREKIEQYHADVVRLFVKIPEPSEDD